MRRRSPGIPVPHFQVGNSTFAISLVDADTMFAIKLPAFTAGIVLLLSIWGVKRSGVSIDPAKEMEDVYKCMQVLKDAETRCVSNV